MYFKSKEDLSTFESYAAIVRVYIESIGFDPSELQVEEDSWKRWRIVVYPQVRIMST